MAKVKPLTDCCQQKKGFIVDVRGKIERQALESDNVYILNKCDSRLRYKNSGKLVILEERKEAQLIVAEINKAVSLFTSDK